MSHNERKLSDQRLIKKHRVEISPGLVIRRSKIHGFGCFAAINFPGGSRIAAYEGERISWEEANRRRQRNEGDCICELDTDWCIDGRYGGNGTEFVNHSCNPSCISLINKDQIVIHAIRDIKPGQEITVDYMSIEEILMIPCACGSTDCLARNRKSGLLVIA